MPLRNVTATGLPSHPHFGIQEFGLCSMLDRLTKAVLDGVDRMPRELSHVFNALSAVLKLVA